ncbi:MAG: phosphonate ABC transporter ATP-binding protein [Candidatus Sericytochromatia bacterium]|nr:phosphonate ABC transporter ATP-binding protein [Candidatus Sericytochromatia bacterium]
MNVTPVAPSSLTQALLTVEGLAKSYGDGPSILHDVNLSFREGEFVVILGLSGAGKSTFLRCLNRLVAPTSGRILVQGNLLKDSAQGLVDVAALPERELRAWRRRVGMIFQQFNLVKRLSVLQNVLSGSLGYQRFFPSLLRWFPAAAYKRALANLERVGLLEQAEQRADRLSGGQQQRVAIARALMQQPTLILADEPVASLDPKLSVVVLDTLQRVAREDRITVLVSLHVLELARRYADRIVGFQGGRVVFDGPPEALTDEVVELIYRRPEISRGPVVGVQPDV